MLMLASPRDFKGVPEFVTLARHFERRSDLRFNLVLNAEASEVDRYLPAATRPRNLEVHPRADDPERFYATADVLLNLSRVDLCVETFGLTIVEGMAFGVPAIVPPVGGPVEIVTDGQDGFTVDSRDLDAVADRLLVLADSAQTAQAMSQAARRRAQDFTVERYGTALRAQIARIGAPPPSHGRHRMKLAILGTVGVPGRYGGFETLAENLARFRNNTGQRATLTVWCSAKDNAEQPVRFEGADLRYVALRANGVQSIPYDAISLWQAVRSGHDRILLLGVSGALALPLIRLISRARIVTNIDGIEWRREKWQGLARMVLRASEWAAVRFSHEVVADNQAIADHVRDTYGSSCHVIAYGGDHALHEAGGASIPEGLPASYALALCRIEPENNVHVILEALDGLDMPLVFVGNWNNSDYGRELKTSYSESPNILMLDPIYDPDALYAVRARASVYLHGHSAGGTNPSLVEMMHFGVPVLAHGCSFNRHSTEGKARYFEPAAELAEQLRNLDTEDADRIGADMLEIAQRKYTWDQIGKAYFELLDRA